MILARLHMLDARGRPVCPDCWAARRLRAVTVDDVELQRTGDLVAIAGGRALLAAFLESLAGVKVVCREGHAVDVESLIARLLCGVVWN